MRTILFALSIGIAAGTVAYANITGAPDQGRSAGVLTCRTLPHATLVFGRTRVAACRFEADRSTDTQSYGALLLPAEATSIGETDHDADTIASESIVWRVVTADGTARPGLLDGRYTLAGPGAILRGASARLELIGGSVTGGVTLAGSDAEIEVGALR